MRKSMFSNFPQIKTDERTSQANFYYGKANRPSTPIRTVINGTYGAVAEYEAVTRNRQMNVLRKFAATAKPNRGHTRASTLCHDAIANNTGKGVDANTKSLQNAFKLSKYKNVTSRVSLHHVNNVKAPRRSIQVAAASKTEEQPAKTQN